MNAEQGIQHGRRVRRRLILTLAQKNCAVCLILTVRLGTPDAARASAICRAAGLPACPQRWRLFNFGRHPSGVIQIPGPAGGCGCSFLADDADWKAPTWDMIPSSLPRLADALRAIRSECVSGFDFEALWIGDSAVDELRVNVEELVHLVEKNNVGTKTRYLVE